MSNRPLKKLVSELFGEKRTGAASIVLSHIDKLTKREEDTQEAIEKVEEVITGKTNKTEVLTFDPLSGFSGTLDKPTYKQETKENCQKFIDQIDFITKENKSMEQRRNQRKETEKFFSVFIKVLLILCLMLFMRATVLEASIAENVLGLSLPRFD